MAFKPDFVWGAATASYQIEGAAYEDGKGLSIWDTFCRQGGRVFEGHTGDVACDHYHRYKEDVSLMREIGLKAYRFSISWPRVMPDGTGSINEKGLAFYEALADELLAAGITPYATLYHWDMPQAMFCRGGWLNPDSPKWFEEYAGVIASRLGSKIKFYMTFNEPQIFIGHGFVNAEHAPGVAFSRPDTLRMAHHVLLAHGRAVKALRKEVADCRIGLAFAGNTYVPAGDRPQDIEAARLATFHVDPGDWVYSTAWWADPIFLGRYPAEAAGLLKDEMPVIKDGDMEIISQPLDFYGLNLYRSDMVEDDGNGGFVHSKPKDGHRKTAIGWAVTPSSLRYVPQYLYERYKAPLYITENGLSCTDGVSADGKVHDPARIDFLSEYLACLHAATEHADVRGYFQWSLMDNFEWAKGYDDRFGLVYIDYESQRRILKDSAYWYKKVIEGQIF